MKNSSFEPGVFEVFRLFVGVRLFIALLSILINYLPINHRVIDFQASPLLGVVETGLLLGYLSWPWLHSRLGKYYLPLALGFATLMPFIESYLTVSISRIDEVVQFRALAFEWQLVIFLLVPLILISWQYSFRVVVGYCLSLAFFDVANIFLISRTTSIPVFVPIGVSLFRILFFLFIGFVITRLVAGQRQQNARLAQANQQLASYANTLEQLTISRERNRLAREFHDTLAHTLSAVAVQLEAVHSLWEANPNQAHTMLLDSLTATRTGLNESRRAIQALRATPLEDMGLGLALTHLARATAERNGLTLDLHVPDELVAINPEAEQNIYRIAEETLHNIDQHAQAKHLWVSLEKANHMISLTIRDDGMGFNLKNELMADRFGLRGMRERAESIGAQFSIESQSQKGTTICLQMEIKNGAGINL